MVRHIFLTVTVTLFVAACATAVITNKYVDPQFQGPIESVMVIGITASETDRATFETEFAKRFQAKGVRAIPSRTVIRNLRGMTEKQIQAIVRQEGVQTVFIARIVNVDQEARWVPPTFGFYRPYYDPFYYSYIWSPGYFSTDTTIHVETTLHDVNSERIVWSATTESFNPRMIMDVIDEQANTIIQEFTRAGLL